MYTNWLQFVLFQIITAVTSQLDGFAVTEDEDDVYSNTADSLNQTLFLSRHYLERLITEIPELPQIPFINIPILNIL